MTPLPHTPTEDVPVLIAGAGPAGLVTAITLARHGVGCLVVDRRRAPSPWPRATAISTASMELLRSWGLEDAVRARSVEAGWRYWSCETLASAAAGQGLRVGLPTPDEARLVSPTAPACAGQDELEALLREHLRTLPAARLLGGAEVVAVDDRPDGVTVVVRGAATGARRTIAARYLVAADGAHSSVRHALGIAMRGPEHLAERLTMLFRAPLWELVGEHRYALYGVAHPREASTFLPAGRPDRWLFAVSWDPERERLEDFTDDVLTRLLRRGAGAPRLQPRLERVGSFSFAAQIADRFRAASTLLIGDAAHRVSPRGGTGMNMAIRDGADVGWKLAWVLRGWAGPELLDTYEGERRPVAEHNLARSADPSGSLRDVDQELHNDLGGRLPHHWVPRGDGGRVSTVDLFGPGPTLLTGPDPARWTAAAAAQPGPLPVAVAPVDAFTARALGLHADGALLARPDGKPAAWWHRAPADGVAALRAAVDGLTRADTAPVAAAAA
jgi:2-polyprenyl-6-methoxyphenol hydroxylase-like FAD-dependent oxidoreductase